MWMMGCSDGGGFNVADSFNGRRLRPLIPRPSSSSSSTTTVTSSTTTTNNSSSTNHIGATAAHPCFSRIHGSNDHFVLNHHLATVLPHEQISKRSDFGAPATVVSSRWNPTPEQLRTLEELYRRGTRTPTAEQIQQITAQLRRFGKIEGKNVFYWFQNHKARERQKRRRRAEEQQQQQRDNTNSTGGGGANLLDNNKESGSSRTDFEIEEEAKNWALPTNCSTLPEETATMRRAERTVAAGAVVSESKTHGWIQFEEEELKQRRKPIEKHQTWKTMQQLHFSPNTHFMNTSITTSSATATSTTTRRTPSAAATMRIMNSSKFIINTQNLADQCLYPLTHFPGLDLSNNINGEDQSDNTLQLFPLRSSAREDHDHQNEINCIDDDDDHAKENDQVEVHPISVMGLDNSSSSANYQFIEFL